ncbi:MAG: AAA family ATPase, partial [Syntrophomonadaceae bacterium]|nr:AAA family ATPase [Syntrophomonadaceae bacterium]
MKIHQLRFQNLNSLAGEWQIDFDNKVFLSNSIFAITGPTGAGKTTILDAICLALYGMTPRLSKVNQSTNEIMSRHSGQCFAELVFETHKGTFRAHWGQHKARNKSDGALQVYKHEVSDVLTGAVLESKASQVPEMIKELTGMDFEQFTRSILLAQGGFAAFLQASPDERAPILEQITGTGIYAQISRKVHERTREEKTRKEELENERSDIQILNDEEEAELRQQVELHTKQKKAEQARQESLDQAIKWLDQISGLENDIADLESLWKELDERKKSFQPDMLRLEQSRKALNLASAYTALSGLRDLQQKELGRLEELREEMPKQKEALENAETLMREATEQLANLKEHQRNEQEKIKKVREIDIRITEQQSTIDKYKHDIDAFKNKIHTIEEQQTETKRKLEQCKLDLKEYESYLRENQADKLLITNLTGIKKTFDRLGASSAQLVDVKNDLQDAEDKHRKAREHFKAKEEIYNKTNTLQKS